MKAFVVMMIFGFLAASGVYLGATEHEIERAFFMFVGVLYGFIVRHKLYSE